MISHEHACIFIHIQKTGGSSLRSALNMPQHDPDKHRFAYELRAKCDPHLWQSYFKFAVVRNPWDRLVSWWAMIERNAGLARQGLQKPNGFQRFILSRARSFSEFLLNCDEPYQDVDGCKWIYRNQIDYVADEHGQIMVDFVGRFERLAQAHALIAARLAVPPGSLPHRNQSPRSAYIDYYTDTLAELVEKRYARDIAAFGYQFGVEDQAAGGTAMLAGSRPAS